MASSSMVRTPMANTLLDPIAPHGILIAQAETGTAPAGEHVVTVDAQGNPVEATQLTHETDQAIGIAETHGESGTFPPFDSSTYGAQLFWLAVTFGLLYILMSRIALPRIGEILEVRRDRIEGDLAEAERLKQMTDQAIATYEEELAEARAKAHAIADETRSKIKADMDEKRRKVEADLSRQMAEAEERITATKSEALANVDKIAAETAVALVSKLSGKVTLRDAKTAVRSVLKD